MFAAVFCFKEIEMKNEKSKAPKIIIIVFSCILAWSVLVQAVAANIIYGFTFETDTSFSPAEDESADSERWIVQSSNHINIKSFDGLNLHALFCENSGSNSYVIICHGYTGRASHMSLYAQNFYNMGYNVLAIDHRAHGKSEGKISTFGAIESKDLLLWIDYVCKSNSNARIVLFGLSMGAGTVMLTTGSGKLPGNVFCAVEDSGFIGAEDIVYYNIRKYAPVPSFCIMPALDITTRIRGGFSISKTSCVEAVKNSTVPTLFIHGSKDAVVPPSSLDTLYNAAKCKKERLLVPDAGHIRSASQNPQLYWNTVKSFIESYK